MAQFQDQLALRSPGARLLNVHGLPGVGKTRLLEEWKRVAERRGRTATLDLRLPGSHQLESALAQLRNEFGAQGVKFERFDVAYTAYWQKIHPNMELKRTGEALGANGEATARILDAASGASLIGAVAAGLKFSAQGLNAMKKSRLVRSEPDLGYLDELPTSDLLHTVTRMFAQDLEDASVAEPYVLFVDSYDMLSIVGSDSTGSSHDRWLRDLLGLLRRGLIVLAGREPVSWKEWAGRSDMWPVLPLEAEYCQELLTNAGVLDEDKRDVITRASQGIPFYLDLAIDTPERESGEREIPQDRIKDRFLDHVPADHRRVLQHLSLARLFNRAVFARFVRDETLWDELVQYSFVRHLSGGWYQLHQLMVHALQAEWSAERQRPVHAALQGFWESYAENPESQLAMPGTPDRAALGFSPWQEAVYHGLRCDGMTAERILACADRSKAVSGSQSATGFISDIRAYVESGEGSGARNEGWSRVARCLAAEDHVLRGRGHLAQTEIGGDDPEPASPLEARLVLAAAHAHRLIGKSVAARDTFERLWTGPVEEVRGMAGYALADITMCAGDFPTAFALADEVYGSVPPGGSALQAEVKRLIHLAHRFLLDFESSQRELDEAAVLFRASNSLHGLADIETNRAELLAFTSPGEAVAAANRALSAQESLHVGHEVGKALTAKGLAETRLGLYAEAGVSFDRAVRTLERVQYRSGRARAELFRAFLHLRKGDRGAAVTSLREAVQRLERADVYPFLSVLAGKAAERIGHSDPEITRIREAAQRKVIPLGTLSDYYGRMDSVVEMLLE
ncbi:hypothetical protein [uncultured Streptomyces sp.]|uniref:hypothetical protein n=1 Tax=uncultured Streptomyces sp. TaxID=174707 RepID=UPI0026250B6E|nr:hypothetical protein [uncultured Streptomyces sp.]